MTGPVKTYYPVLIQRTESRIAYVAAERLGQLTDGDVLQRLWADGEDVTIEAGLRADAQTPAVAQAAAELNEEPIGPVEQCPACGVLAHYAESYGLEFARHEQGCRWFLHRPTVVGWDAPRDARCSCGFTPPGDVSAATAVALLRDHVANHENVAALVPHGVEGRRVEAAAIRRSRAEP